MAFAGGVFEESAPNTYYYRNSKSSECTGKKGDPCSVCGSVDWWTMSPSQSIAGTQGTIISVSIYGYKVGSLASASITNNNYLRPVITLKPEVLVTGSGTTNDPYIPSLS